MFYWKKIDAQGKTTTVESCSINIERSAEFARIDKAEFDAFIATLPTPPSRRNLQIELDDLKVKLIAKGIIS